MGKTRPMTLLKLGGSLITNKDKLLSVNRKRINQVARALGSSPVLFEKQRLFIIHGGGSFGHYYAKKYGVSSIQERASRKKKRVDPRYVSKIEESMMELHSIVLKSLVDAGVPCCSVLAHEILKTSVLRTSSEGIKRVQELFYSGNVPITFGNVGLSPLGPYIISGDAICGALARSMQVSKLVFAMDVDGIFPSSNLHGEILQTIRPGQVVDTKLRRYDVTGGIFSKIDLGLEVAKLGAEVYYLNGKNPERVLNALHLGNTFGLKATIIKPAKTKSTLGFSY